MFEFNIHIIILVLNFNVYPSKYHLQNKISLTHAPFIPQYFDRLPALNK